MSILLQGEDNILSVFKSSSLLIVAFILVTTYPIRCNIVAE